MIKLIHGYERSSYPDLFNNMFSLRARVFSERLGWKVDVQNGFEIDNFDRLDPLYGFYTNDQNDVLGSFRLLQTTGPTMLRDVFPRCLPDGLDVRSPLVWESTRFCVDTQKVDLLGGVGLNVITSSMISSLMEIGLVAGLSHIVTVIDVRMERILRRAGCPIENLGDPVDYGGVRTLAVLVECTEASVAFVQNKTGLMVNQLQKEDVIKLRAA